MFTLVERREKENYIIICILVEIYNLKNENKIFRLNNFEKEL